MKIKKKAKGTKVCVIKRKFKFECYEDCLGANQHEKEIKSSLKENEKRIH